jgi:hypothetical protein
MPESVTDRPTKAHEYLFLLSKSGHYFYDMDAIKEESTGCESFGNHGLKVSLNNDRQDGSRSDPTPRNFRNKRSVWALSVEPYRGAHFATMPTALVEPCILAGTSKKGCCPTCGSPWQRTIETEGWAPTCGCERKGDLTRGVVLDVFSGSGTTGAVANRLGRDYIGIDLNPDFLPLAKSRILGNEPPEITKNEDSVDFSDFFGEEE